MPPPAFVPLSPSVRALPRRSAAFSARPSFLPRLAAAPLFAALAFSSAFVPGARAACDDAADSSGRCAAPSMATSLKELSGLKTVDGSPIADDAFDGKVVLAVNVASACGTRVAPLCLPARELHLSVVAVAVSDSFFL